MNIQFHYTKKLNALVPLQDAYLPQRLLDKLMFIYNYVEMARVTGVPISFLLARGQSIKVSPKLASFFSSGNLTNSLYLQVLSQLLRKARQRNLVIPNVKQAGSEQGTYEGATVRKKVFIHQIAEYCCWKRKVNTCKDPVVLSLMYDLLPLLIMDVWRTIKYYHHTFYFLDVDLSG